MTRLVRPNIYQQYIEGDAMPMETLRSLYDDYEELDSAYKSYEKMRETVREQMSNVLVKLDGKAEIPGKARLMLTEPAVVKGYDPAALDALIDGLADEYPYIASQIAGCRKKTMRSGGLRIERVKG